MKTQTKKEAIKAKKVLTSKGKDAHIYKFASKRKWQYFVGTYFEWLLQIS